jgi:hypothetical protein
MSDKWCWHFILASNPCLVSHDSSLLPLFFPIVFRYNVQLDVLRQLEQKVKDLIVAQRKAHGGGPGPSNLPQTLTKLERDFERVQGLAHSAKAKVSRQQKQLQQRGSTIPVMEENSSANALQMEQERFQMQIQQDVSIPFAFSCQCFALFNIANQLGHCHSPPMPPPQHPPPNPGFRPTPM